MRQADDDSYDMREADEPAPSAGVTHVAQDDIGCESLLKRRRAATTASMAPRDMVYGRKCESPGGVAGAACCSYGVE